jgi:8-oxo-dGTP pyrophosphatase MutT (NUDIX family)
MDELRKVTAFVTRGRGREAELLVFRHGISGVQVPAGTVEQGESFEAAVVRETMEETGLTGDLLPTRLGQRTYSLPQNQAVLRRQVALRVAPADDAHQLTNWPLAPGVPLRVLDRAEGYVRVAFELRDLEDDPETGTVYVRVEGWLPEDAVGSAGQVREFFHIAFDGSTSRTWDVWAEGRYTFHLYWEPLMPRPALVRGQDEWLNEFYDDLLRLVGAG